MLNVSAVGHHENFFELGGHSLLAVQLLSRVRQIYGVELSLEVVYSGEFTVAELAKAIELKEIEQAGGDYQDLLAELERLSEDEVRALLDAEQDAVPPITADDRLPDHLDSAVPPEAECRPAKN